MELQPKKATGEELVKELIGREAMDSAKVLVVTGNRNREVVVEKLNEARAIVDQLPVYRTEETDLSTDPAAADFRAKGADAILFASPSAVQSFFDQAPALKLAAKARKLGATVPDDAMLLLGEGKFRRPVMLEVENAPDARDIERPGGAAFTRIAPAAPGAVKGVVEETVKVATGRFGRKPDTIWLWYLTCRTCSGERDFETLVVAHYR